MPPPRTEDQEGLPAAGQEGAVGPPADCRQGGAGGCGDHTDCQGPWHCEDWGGQVGVKLVFVFVITSSNMYFYFIVLSPCCQSILIYIYICQTNE